MRTLQDSDDTAGFTPGADFYAGYVLSDTGEGHNNYASMVARFPNAGHISICTRFNARAQVLDYESGTTGTGGSNPARAVSWVQQQRLAGANPTVYVNTSTLPELVAAFKSYGVTEPPWWLAHWTNVPHLEGGSAVTQYGGAPGVDYNLVADYWPGIDPAPLPPEDEEYDMLWCMTVNPLGQAQGYLVFGGARVGIDPDTAGSFVANNYPKRVDMTWAVVGNIPELTASAAVAANPESLALTASGTITFAAAS